ncbi:uncharacterized conserved protein [Longilinea arvoryzae]|uniref:Uncharacterized conserved protein n=1 Tax=Longilinea arvoryzae TaxID=360412 RepID=A0A0S7BAT8_9CHLR|nr:DUF1028 domain-containing protein [Longilinea arvoryzae]GAP14815.1 uncharacterized conserved protein [Longilinea arvoryzae]
MTHRFPFAHTFSIVARDPSTGQMGAAIQSHWFSVGSLVIWGEAGVGVVATQAMVDPSYGNLGLELMRAGRPATRALVGLLAADEGRDLRQVAMLDCHADVAVHTGSRCIQDAGHETGDAFSVQANMMANPSIWPAMAKAYRESSGTLTARLLEALEAGQAAGGDIRGKQSAAILVVAPTSTGRPWADRLIDLRVEDHPDPILDLKRLVQLHDAYEWMNTGDQKLGEGDIDAALAAYQRAAGLAPTISELPFWQAVTLIELKRVDEALPILKDIFSLEPAWRTLFQRLPAAGLLNTDSATLARVLASTR